LGVLDGSIRFEFDPSGTNVPKMIALSNKIFVKTEVFVFGNILLLATLLQIKPDHHFNNRQRPPVTPAAVFLEWGILTNG
jgi:hypothetical protein